jgi:hypothetical protein
MLDVVGNIFVFHLEVRDLSGELATSGVRMSDIFTLLGTEGGWKIRHKAFLWHNR